MIRDVYAYSDEHALRYSIRKEDELLFRATPRGGRLVEALAPRRHVAEVRSKSFRWGIGIRVGLLRLFLFVAHELGVPHEAFARGRLRQDRPRAAAY